MSDSKELAKDEEGISYENHLSKECIEELKCTIAEGDLVFPDSPLWSEFTSTFVLSTKKTIKPLVVVRPLGTMEVASAVKIGRKYGIDMAVKSGGHSLSQAGLADGGMTIDLGLMRSVCVDPISKTATVDGGAQLGDVDSETALYKLLIPVGVAPTTGMGLVLNGGQGIASRAYGCAADSILSLTLVDANGSVMFVSKDSHPDLFWGMCGAGTAFGVVTKMTLRLHPAEPFVGGTMQWEDDPEHNTFKAICRFMRDAGFKEPNFGMNVSIGRGPHGRVVASMICFLGDEKSREEKLQFLKPLRDLGTIKDTTGEWSYYETQNTDAELHAKVAKIPKHAYGMSGAIPADKVSEEMLNVLVHEVMDGAPPEVPLGQTYFDIWGGAMTNSQAPTAFRGSEMGFYCIPVWLDSRHNSVGMAWGRRVKELLAPFMSGAEYVNCSPQEQKGDEKAATYVGGIENLKRLRELKQKYDPDNIFHLHQLKALL